MKAITITTTSHVDTLELTEATELADLQRAVGGYIQIIELTEELAMVIEEEGKLKNKPVNDIATRLTQHFNAGLQADDAIVGDAVLIGQRNGSTIDVPALAVDALERLGFPIPRSDA